MSTVGVPAQTHNHGPNACTNTPTTVVVCPCQQTRGGSLQALQSRPVVNPTEKMSRSTRYSTRHNSPQHRQMH